MNNSITTGILRELGLHGMAEEFSCIIMLPIQRRDHVRDHLRPHAVRHHPEGKGQHIVIQRIATIESAVREEDVGLVHRRSPGPHGQISLVERGPRTVRRRLPVDQDIPDHRHRAGGQAKNDKQDVGKEKRNPLHTG